MRTQMRLACLVLVLAMGSNVFGATLTVGAVGTTLPEYDTAMIDQSNTAVASGTRRYTFSNSRLSGQTMTVTENCSISGITFIMEQNTDAFLRQAQHDKSVLSLSF